MPKHNKPIPLITLPPDIETGILIIKTAIKSRKGVVKEVQQPHRDDWHLFILQVGGSTIMEVDFQQYVIKPSSIYYIHPNQVHRVVSFKDAVFYSLIIHNRTLRPEYLQILDDISPAQPLRLSRKASGMLTDIVNVCQKAFEMKKAKLYTALLKDSCHTFVAAFLSQYLAHANSADIPSRFHIIAKSFKAALEENFINIKSPREYAQRLNISTPYLNECVRQATGHSVSYQIQQRIILEAARLLYHSNMSVKEIAHELGYEDHSYFIRLFSKVTGMTPLVFRNKNHESSYTYFA
ncbi:helix-turn-helix transcriptional regulator [Chitinophaga sp.]|uniref:AraC family transcriptional regulator n=1 Tax=Chitinophaga sp. TaxID=1869181 RepID=UPI0031CF755C